MSQVAEAGRALNARGDDLCDLATLIGGPHLCAPVRAELDSPFGSVYHGDPHRKYRVWSNGSCDTHIAQTTPNAATRAKLRALYEADCRCLQCGDELAS